MAVTGGLAPNQRPMIARLGLKALLAGSLSNLMSAALAGMILAATAAPTTAPPQAAPAAAPTPATNHDRRLRIVPAFEEKRALGVKRAHGHARTRKAVASVSLLDADRDPEGFSQELGGSFERYGFAIVADHGIPADLIAPRRGEGEGLLRAARGR